MHAIPTLDPDGTVHVPPVALPPSKLLSAEGLAAQRSRGAMAAIEAAEREPDIAVRRQRINDHAAPAVARLRAGLPVTIVEDTIGGVRVLDVRDAYARIVAFFRENLA